LVYERLVYERLVYERLVYERLGFADKNSYVPMIIAERRQALAA